MRYLKKKETYYAIYLSQVLGEKESLLAVKYQTLLANLQGCLGKEWTPGKPLKATNWISVNNLTSVKNRRRS